MVHVCNSQYLVGMGRRMTKKFKVILSCRGSPDLSRIHETLFQEKEITKMPSIPEAEIESRVQDSYGLAGGGWGAATGRDMCKVELLEYRSKLTTSIVN